MMGFFYTLSPMTVMELPISANLPTSFRAQYVPMLTMVNVQLLLPEVLFFLVNIGKPHVVVVILMT